MACQRQISPFIGSNFRLGYFWISDCLRSHFTKMYKNTKSQRILLFWSQEKDGGPSAHSRLGMYVSTSSSATHERHSCAEWLGWGWYTYMDDISVDCNFTQIQTLIIDDDVISLWTLAFERWRWPLLESKQDRKSSDQNVCGNRKLYEAYVSAKFHTRVWCCHLRLLTSSPISF